MDLDIRQLSGYCSQFPVKVGNHSRFLDLPFPARLCWKLSCFLLPEETSCSLVPSCLAMPRLPERYHESMGVLQLSRNTGLAF
jgi:hypothetical protein